MLKRVATSLSLWIGCLAGIAAVDASAQTSDLLREGITLGFEDGSLRLNAEYGDVVALSGGHNLDYSLKASVPLDFLAEAVKGATLDSAGPGYRASARLGYTYGDVVHSSAVTALNINAANGGSGSNTEHFFSVSASVGGAYDGREVVAKDLANWSQLSPTPEDNYRVEAGLRLTWQVEWTKFIFAFTVAGGTTWSHEFDVEVTEVCTAAANQAPGTTECRELPTTLSVPDEAIVNGDLSAGLLFLFYGPEAKGQGQRVNPGLELGYAMTVRENADGEKLLIETQHLKVGAFVTPDFGWSEKAPYLRTGVTVEIPLETVVEESTAFTLTVGAAF